MVWGTVWCTVWGARRGVHRVDRRAKVEVVLPLLVAPAYLPKDGEVVGLFVWVLVVYREVVGALELVLARRPAVWRERFYARERDRLPIDDSIHPRDLWGGRRRGR